MRQSVLFALVFALAISATFQQAALGSLNDKFRRAAPAGFAGLGSYVTGLRSFGFFDQVSFPRSQINQHLQITKTYTMSQGVGRLLRGGRGYMAPRPVARPVARFVGRPVLFRGRIAVRPAAPVDPFGGATTAFKPWNGLGALKFGTSYSNIAVDSQLRFPGLSWVKATGIVAIRHGDTIEAKAGYGWTVGFGAQLTTSTVVRRCRRTLFWRRCWNERITIPRGVNAGELHSISDGMNHLLFNKIAEVSGPRLLRMSSSQSAELVGEFVPGSNLNKKVLTGVKGSDIHEALSAIIGHRVKVNIKHIMSGRKVQWAEHVVHAAPEDSTDLFTLTVENQ